MNTTVIEAEQVPAQPWRNGGGQTRELLVWPQSESLGGKALCVGKGGARKAGGGHEAECFATQTPAANQAATAATTKTATDWQLRISRADIEANGPFSAFAGVDRWFAVMSGNGVVLHMPTADGHTLEHHLFPGHKPLHFDGGLAPGCTLVDGATLDLNLMARGGKAIMQTVEAEQPWTADFAMRGIYTATSGVWTDGAQTIKLAAHSLLWTTRASVDSTTASNAAFRFTARGNEPTRAWWLGFTPDTTP